MFADRKNELGSTWETEVKIKVSPTRLPIWISAIPAIPSTSEAHCAHTPGRRVARFFVEDIECTTRAKVLKQSDLCNSLKCKVDSKMKRAGVRQLSIPSSTISTARFLDFPHPMPIGCPMRAVARI
jgi:hypothetical protein